MIATQLRSLKGEPYKRFMLNLILSTGWLGYGSGDDDGGRRPDFIYELFTNGLT